MAAFTRHVHRMHLYASDVVADSYRGSPMIRPVTTFQWLSAPAPEVEVEASNGEPEKADENQEEKMETADTVPTDAPEENKEDQEQTVAAPEEETADKGEAVAGMFLAYS